MSCKLCKKPIDCAHCNGMGEMKITDTRGIEYTIDCPICNNLHAKCFLIMIELQEKWFNERQAREFDSRQKVGNNEL